MASVKKIMRHGDILICQCEGFKIPDGMTFSKMPFLFKGNQHIHSIESGLALEGNFQGMRYMRVVEPVTLNHTEHGKGSVPVGDYWIEQKREFDHFAEEARTVID